jgi:hypothetical protein
MRCRTLLTRLCESYVPFLLLPVGGRRMFISALDPIDTFDALMRAITPFNVRRAMLLAIISHWENIEPPSFPRMTE